MKEILIILLCLLFEAVISYPPGNLVVRIPKGSKKNNEKEAPILLDPIIYDMNIHCNISNRFAKTLVTSKVRNPNKQSRETTFTVVLPEKAFISGFVLKIGGKEYKAYVKEKEEAKKIYEVARQRGQTAGHVAVSARDSNTFTISVNVEPEAKAAFLLTYEELLERKNDQYDLVMNIHPGQVVEKLDVKVVINESRPLRFVRTPSLRTGNEVDKNLDSSNELSKIEMIGKKTAIVEFHPDKEQQKQFAIKFGKAESEGLAGQFVVQYDVQRDPNGGEVLLQDGYFVHFFAPDNLEPLPKHIVFVLDTSGSMGGHRMKQLKDAMNNIIEQLQPGDEVSLIEFNSNVFAWNIETGTKKQFLVDNYENPFDGLDGDKLPQPILINGNVSMDKAKKVITKLNAGGSTNIIGALEAALSLVKTFIGHKNDANKNLQPMIMFLTDGEPMGSGEHNTKKQIHKIILKVNSENNGVPIYTLSFGNEADKGFLRRLSLENSGFSRHIYEGADASFQLENFYKEISVPLLSDIKFEYADAVNVTRYRQPVFFKGSEIAICGVYDPALDNPLGSTKIRGIGNGGQISLVPSIEKPVSSLERLWAYLTVKHMLDKRETANTDLEKYKITKQALELALKFSFVTDITSLVVVKPNDTYTSNPLLVPRRILTRRPALGVPAAAALESFSANRFEAEDEEISNRIGGWGQAQGDSHGPLAPAPAPEHAYSKVSSTPRPVATTYKPLVRIYETTTSIPSTLKTNLPWLESVLSPNGTLNIHEGTFILGKESSGEDCLKTPLNETGVCTPLEDCPEVFTYLTDLETYEQYFCPIKDKYAGVCCPKKKTAEN